MPILPVEEIQELIPEFRGGFGKWVASTLRKWLSIGKVSDLYDRTCQSQGADFAEALLKDLRVDVRVGCAEKLKNLPEGPFITISNHPYGGLDGIMLIDLIGHLRPGFKVMVNQVLSLVKALRPSLISVNPKDDNNLGMTVTNLKGIRQVMQSLQEGFPVGIFPSGAVSDYVPKENRIRDREWQAPVLRLIKKSKVPIVPIHFLDRNSGFYYYLGLINWKIRVARLPAEIVNKAGKQARLVIGDTIPVDAQSRFSDVGEFGAFLRDSVYSMPVPDQFVSRWELLT